MLQRTRTINVNMVLPHYWSRVQAGLLPKLRTIVSKKTKEFVKNKETSKKANNTELFRTLDSRAAAYTTPLMHQFLAASSAYSCATPDNRIKLDVEKLEQIQEKDNKLREEESNKVEKLLEQSKNKLRETQKRLHSMNTTLDGIRAKIREQKALEQKERKMRESELNEHMELIESGGRETAPLKAPVDLIDVKFSNLDATYRSQENKDTVS